MKCVSVIWICCCFYSAVCHSRLNKVELLLVLLLIKPQTPITTVSRPRWVIKSTIILSDCCGKWHLYFKPVCSLYIMMMLFSLLSKTVENPLKVLRQTWNTLPGVNLVNVKVCEKKNQQLKMQFNLIGLGLSYIGFFGDKIFYKYPPPTINARF